jgi:two-component system, NtrC family, sensor kinase
VGGHNLFEFDMTLGRKIILRNVALLVGLLLLAGFTSWGLWSLRLQVRAASTETSEMRQLILMGDQMTQARADLTAGDYGSATNLLQRVVSDARGYGTGDPARLKTMREDQPEYFAWDQKVRSELSAGAADVCSQAQNLLRKNATDPALPAKLDRPIKLASKAVAECAALYMSKSQQQADRTLLITLGLFGGLCAVILFGAVKLSRWHYQSVMGPLNRLRDWVRRAGGGEFPPPLEINGDLEFCELAVDFNQMAKQLHEFYHELDTKVQQTSRELVRSQRLASVGFLAAGVAHEINNPLNIMSGYAELTISRLGRGFDPAAADDAQRAMEVIRQETFRCKQITAKLLSTARGSGEEREAFSLRQVAREVVSMIEGLKPFHNRHLDLQFDDEEPLEIQANINEIKQVLLNLTMNALEAVQPERGRVCLSGRRDRDWVELSVRDNGRGMEQQTLDRVFEPFFTDKRGVGPPGTGLGLCITHAIVESHGGRIAASSDGLGMGSVFTVRFPALPPREARMRISLTDQPAHQETH